MRDLNGGRLVFFLLLCEIVTPKTPSDESVGLLESFQSNNAGYPGTGDWKLESAAVSEMDSPVFAGLLLPAGKV